MNPRPGETTADMAHGADDMPDDPRLMQAVQEYLQDLESGRKPDRSGLLRRYADLAEPLKECLDGLELVHNSARRTTAVSAVDGTPANPLGDFQIVREIGRGGMGVVYEAVQLSLGRRVALKVLPFAATLEKKHLQRFENEARAAALLHHTNIVPVYAVGCERGVHFYAMQLIEGHTLAAVIQQIRDQESGVRGQESGVRSQGSGAGRALSEGHDIAGIVEAREETVSQLSLALTTQRTRHGHEYFRAAARFIMQAADALDHAHQYGIIHRDIKPGNLMVDHAGRLWITDFGLAQFHTDAGLTQTGDILGTLRYMSPEQASGQRVLLDHRTDVYSLGATLYELATLSPMFPGQNRQELLRQILNDEPKPPSNVDPKMPVELETIILKAVNKTAADRYGSAREFAADLQRYLDDQPIQAKRPSVVERGRKWARRHPSVIAAAVIVLFFGALGLAISTALIAAEQGRTRKAYEAERKKAAEAEQRFQLARRSADEMIRLAEEELAGNPAMYGLRKRLLEAALAYYQEFIELRREDADAQVDLAATRDRVKKILSDLALMQGAGQQFLLKESAVLDDLRLSEEQRGQMELLVERMDKQRNEIGDEFHRLGVDEKQKRFLEMARANDAGVSAILKPAQLKRLRQIALQCQGSWAFLDSDVGAALMLSADQRRQIRAAFFEKGPPFGRPGGPPPKKGKGPERFRRPNLTKPILAMLTPEQNRLWNEMIGEPFERAEWIFYPPGGAFRPPPPDRPGPKSKTDNPADK